MARTPMPAFRTQARARQVVGFALVALMVACSSARELDEGEAGSRDAGQEGPAPADASGAPDAAPDVCDGVLCGAHRECLETRSGFARVCVADPACPSATEVATFCHEGTERHCVEDGDGCVHLDEDLDVGCAEMGRTCRQGACQGSCAQGTYRCDGGGRSQFCDDEGEWGPPISCRQDQICEHVTTDPQHGRCVDNAPLPWGLSSPGADVWSLDDDHVYAQPVRATDDVTLLGFGMVTTPEHQGGQVHLALHADDGGEPGAPINETDRFGPSADSDNYRDRASSTAASTELEAGALYWIVVYVDEEPAYGDDVQIYLSSATADGNCREGDIGRFSSPFNLAGETGAVSGALSLWIRVRRR